MNSFSSASALLLTAILSSACSVMAADNNRVVYETEIDADIDAVWNAFTTSDGLRTWMAPLVEIELAVGGKMKSNYNAKGKIGDETTIENTILSFDPKRMLSLKATGFPKGFPFEDAAKATWSVFYFTELPSSRTRISVVGLGYTDDEQSKKMRSFFATANKQSLDKLKEALKQRQAAKSSEASDEDVAAAYAWAKKKLAVTRSTQLPSLRGNPSLPLVRPLTSLILFNVSVTDEELRHLAAFPKLKSLALSGKGLTNDGLKQLVMLNELETLSLGGTSISDAGMKQLAKLRNMKRLELAGAKLTGAGIRELAGLPKLRDLSLIRSAIDDNALKEVGELKELRELNLRKTMVSDEALKHLARMPELRVLVLQSTAITAEGLRHLAPCKSLRLVYCWGTDVTDEEIRQLKEILPNCEVDKVLIE